MTLIRDLTLACILIVASVIAITYGPVLADSRYVPACEEDAVLVGTGDFDGDRFESLVCGPALDDFRG